MKHWPFWVVGAVVGGVIGATASAFDVPTWQTFALILIACTTITVAAQNWNA